MRALSVRQPYAEEILLGIKKVEYRSIPTRIIGERFYIYASTVPGDRDRFAALNAEPGQLPTGVLVGTVEITQCAGSGREYHWHLTRPERLKRPRKPKRRPQPVWFTPF